MTARKFPPQVIDESGNIATPSPRIDLHDAHAIRRELGAVYRDMRAGRIATQDGTRLAYVLDMMRKAYEASVLQERIETLERTIDTRNRKNEKRPHDETIQRVEWI